MNIENKVVVVTGGARGIGLALAKRFLLEEAKTIILVDLKFDDLELNNNKFVCKKCKRLKICINILMTTFS